MSHTESVLGPNVTDAIAFVDAKTLNSWQASWATSWGGTQVVQELKGKYPNMKVMAVRTTFSTYRDDVGMTESDVQAWGGWGQDYYYREKCATEAGRQELAAAMAQFTQAQGLEYVTHLFCDASSLTPCSCSGRMHKVGCTKSGAQSRMHKV